MPESRRCSFAFKFVFSLAVFVSALFVSFPAKAQSARRAVTQLGDFTLSMAMAGDNVWLFELSDQEISAAQPFDFSIMVTPGLSVTVPSGGGNSWSGDAAQVTLSQSPPSISITGNDGTESFVISPYAPDGQLSGISFTGDYTHLFGLGADYRLASDVFSLMGETVMPGGPFGNRRLARQGYRPNQVQIPVLYALGESHKSTALFVDETRPLMWSFKGSPWVASVAGPLGPKRSFRFFVILGADMPSLRRQFMSLTGRPPVPPEDALGVWASDMDEGPDTDWQGKIANLRTSVPGLTGLCLRAVYTEGAAVYEVAKANNLRVMVDESAYVPQDSSNFSEMARRSYLVRQGGPDGPPLVLPIRGKNYGLVDYTNNLGHTFWHSLQRQELINEGFNFFRLVDGDLDSFSASAYYDGGPGASAHSHYAWSNVYPLKWLEGIAAGTANQWMRNRPRLFLLSRTAMAGLPRLAGALYNGEAFLFNTRTLMAIKAHVSLSGIDYYSSDLGSSIQSQPVSQFGQVYDIWLAKSAFTDLPLILPESLLARPATRYNLALRESLKPYYYSLAWEAHLSGNPIIAPLAYHFQDDQAARDRIAELMIGQWLLVGLNLEGSNNERTSVYVPQGQWYNWRTGEMIDQQEAGTVQMDLKDAGQITPPLLARAGAIIPAMEEASVKSGPPVKIPALKIFIGSDNSTFTWYEDDGVTQSYLNGRYGKTTINAVTGADGSTVVTIKAREGFWEGAPDERQLLIDVYGPKAPGEATLDNLPHNRVAHTEELDELDSGWVSLGNNRIRFKTPLLEMNKDHVLWFK
ncbi:hypothetical protein C4J81_18245 [Deltaproteobacteria bacterium Smac51]|nr:hypothetical protein C4J81_18245 [Deltaproteobacteria bacterium Smac51]